MDLYFERHDGQAVTIDDFVAAMEDANGVDFTRLSVGTVKQELLKSRCTVLLHRDLTLNMQQKLRGYPECHDKSPSIFLLALPYLMLRDKKFPRFRGS